MSLSVSCLLWCMLVHAHGLPSLVHTPFSHISRSLPPFFLLRGGCEDEKCPTTKDAAVQCELEMVVDTVDEVHGADDIDTPMRQLRGSMQAMSMHAQPPCCVNPSSTKHADPISSEPPATSPPATAAGEAGVTPDSGESEAHDDAEGAEQVTQVRMPECKRVSMHESEIRVLPLDLQHSILLQCG